MIKRGVVLLALAALLVAEPAQAADHVKGELLVQFKSNTSAAERADTRRELGATPKESMPLPGLQLLKLPEGTSVGEADRVLEDNPAVARSTPNYLGQLGALPNDARIADEWGLNNLGQALQPGYFLGRKYPVVPPVVDADIDAAEAWEISTGSKRVIAADLDTGIASDLTASTISQSAHPDLEPNIYRNPGEAGNGRESNGIDDDGDGLQDDYRGWDFAGEINNPPDNVPVDLVGHGTHTAGTIGAVGNNGIGVAGVNWNVSLLPLKVCNLAGCPESAVVRAIDYAARQGARVINMSLSYETNATDIRAAIAAHPELLVVVIPGNAGVGFDIDQSSTMKQPCEDSSLTNVICVASSDADDGISPFSNYGATSVDLAAPGKDVMSTYPTGGPGHPYGNHPGGPYGYDSGTSMSAPHVTGAAALLWSSLPSASVAQIRSALLSSVDPAPEFAGKTVTVGRLNLKRAIDALPTPTVSVTGGIANYVDAAGRTNKLTVARSGSTYTFTDPSAQPKPGTGCSRTAQTNPSPIKCTGVTATKVELGEADDQATLVGAAKGELIGGPGKDNLTGGTNEDTLRGGPGQDVLVGGEGNDTLNGDEDIDVMFGATGNDVSLGGDGNDLLIDGLGEIPESGKDTMDGGRGADFVVSGKGADTIRARDHWSDPLIDCGPDKDTAELDLAPYDPVATGCETVTRSAGSTIWSPWESLPAQGSAPQGDPGAVSSQLNRVDLFTAAGGNSIVQRSFDGNWSGDSALAPLVPTTSGPDVASQAPGTLDVFAVGGLGQLRQNSFDGHVWSGWQQTGTSPLLNSGPSAVSWSNGRLDVFARQVNDNDIQHRYFANGQWQPWESLGGFITFDPDATSMRPGHLALFARGNQNKVFWKECTQAPCASANWGAWSQIPGQDVDASSPVAATSTEDGKMDLFVRGPAPGYNLLHKSYSNGSWSPANSWENLGGSLDSGPDAASWGPGRIDVFAKGQGNTILHRWTE